MFTSTGWQEEFARGSDIGTAEGKEKKKKRRRQKKQKQENLKVYII